MYPTYTPVTNTFIPARFAAIIVPATVVAAFDFLAITIGKSILLALIYSYLYP